NYEDVRRRAVMQSARMAGLNVVRLINEPTAAAMAYGIQALNAEELLLVYDFGGGTLDVTILEMIQGVLDVRTSRGVAELGGKDMDASIMQWAQAEFARKYPSAKVGAASERRLKAQAEPAKKTLSTYDSASIIVENYATLDGELLDLDLKLSRSLFEAMIRPLIDRSIQAVDEALEKAGTSASQLTKALLVGGTTWIPSVRTAVLSHLGRPAVSGCDPDLAVSMGACISAALAAGEVDSKSSLVVQDVCTYGLGTLTVQHVGGIMALAYEELMPPNTPIPYSIRRDHYSLLRPDQEQLKVDLVQDLRGKAVWPDDTTPTGCSGTLTGIRPSETGEPHDVSIEFHYDANGMVHLRAWLPELNDLELVLVHRVAGEGAPGTIPDDVSIDSMWEQAPLGGKYAPFIHRAEAAIAESPPNAAQIRSALVELKTKISMGAETEAEEASDRLIDLLAEA
ncbi:MAG: Hsp70 family protein, partial [Armatimonadetes bacterium]|nr:Hsp70 family protein [Armatimonadota bacterium]